MTNSTYTPIGVNATSAKALAIASLPPLTLEQSIRLCINSEHICTALDQLVEEMELQRGDMAPTIRETHILDFVERIEERALELVRAEYTGEKA